MSTLPRLIRTILALSLICLAFGCEAKGPKRYDRWGKVTFKGQPIPRGTIHFDPDLHAPNDGPQGYADIVNGEFDTRKAPGLGSGSGKYFLRINAADGIPGPEAPMGKALFSPEVLIARELPTEGVELTVEIPANMR